MNLINFVTYLLYVLLIVGIYMLFSDSFYTSANNMRAQAIIAKDIKQKENQKKKKSSKNDDNMSLTDYIERMLIAVDGKADGEDITKFYLRSILLSIIGGVLSYLIMTPKVVPLFMVILLVLPFLMKRVKLQEIRSSFSREGEVLISELLSNYKAYSRNMELAIKTTARTLNEDIAPYSRRAITLLDNRITAADDFARKRAIEQFKFSLDTSWASILATNFELSLTDRDVNVENAMEDLLSTVTKARKTMEETKRQGNEGNKMLKIMVPGIYILTIICAFGFFDLTPEEFFHNQFKTDAGSMLFLTICITYIISLIVSTLVGREKMDI